MSKNDNYWQKQTLRIGLFKYYYRKPHLKSIKHIALTLSLILFIILPTLLWATDQNPSYDTQNLARSGFSVL